MNQEKTLQKLERKLDLIEDWLKKKDIKYVASMMGIIDAAYKALGRKRKKTRTGVPSMHAYTGNILVWTGLVEKNRDLENPPNPAAYKIRGPSNSGKYKEFYQSFEWRKLRFTILEKFGARCMLCGASPREGHTMHVDHIKPLRFNWDLRLDPENLQILCAICNHGKASWSETDFREALIKGEINPPEYED